MATSLIESQRASHQQLETFEAALVSLLCIPDDSYKLHRERLGAKHRASYLLDRISDRSNEMRETYADQDGLRRNEMDKLASNGGISEFYDRLAKLKEFHRKYPDSSTRAGEDEESRVDFTPLTGGGAIDGRDFLDRMFSGEEFLGRYIDLVALHDQHSNLGHGIKRLHYLQYLEDFDAFDKIPRPAKTVNDKYATYVQNLLDYLKSFFARAYPLRDLEKELLEASISEFNRKWDRGQVEGWEKTKESGSAAQEKATTSTDAGIWCDACQRSYAKQTVYDAHLTSKKHVKAANNLQNGTSNGTKNGSHSTAPSNASSSTSAALLKSEKERSIALMEFQIRALVSDYDSPLLVVRNDTKANVERRQALTDKERQQENEELEERERKEAEETSLRAERAARVNRYGIHNPDTDGGGAGPNGINDDDDEEERIYNPLKLPLGWDGKPIPFWLYKLHGLGVEYKCEICSNFSYRGRKNFERHFQEARHAFNMRALGLPNTKHFHEITKISDAIALAEKLKTEGRSEIVFQEQMEEVEDEMGNVYNKKTYEDLKRQGLI